MTTLTLEIPDDEVDTFVIRRMGQGEYHIFLTHRFGFALDQHGQILGPDAPRGCAMDHDPGLALERALEHLRKEVELRKTSQPKATYVAKPAPAFAADFDLEL
jgi:hypothetical protein